MITHLRIDNRLIHGQVAISWLKYIGAKAIIVCNDKVANDPIQKMALPMAARNTKVLVFSIAETIKYVNDNPDETIFIIAKFPLDALAIIKTGEKIKEINVGNAAPIAGTKYVMVTKSIAATKEDAEVYRQIADLVGGKLTSQIMPHNETTDFIAALKKAKLL
jgi:PTS system mannose-specific IIB component